MTTFKLSCSRKTKAEPTQEVMQIAQAFGIGADEEHEIVLYKDLEVRLGRGRVVFITGESGAGKTTLLRDLKKAAEADESLWSLDGLAPIADDRPVINQFILTAKEAIELLTFAGLTEPFVWLRRASELSDGQRYRLQLARAMWVAQSQMINESGRVPVLFFDEFLANLDRETARGVAHMVRKVATARGICFVVATTHPDIAEDLNPNQKITMRLGMPPELQRKLVL